MGILENKDSIYREPRITTSILANIPECLYSVLQDNLLRLQKRGASILVSSNSLANRFILDRWGIRSSQRRRYKNLFSTIRKQCRAIFRNYLAGGKIKWRTHEEELVFGVYKFDEVRGNLILGFVPSRGYLAWSRVSEDL
ncbi:MAG: hypothetical protein EAX87_12910 [Candidatus Thorarchaeota archaeon]|nr:hypothetical protein [Candidatus Thorarchaeota archaeon]